MLIDIEKAAAALPQLGEKARSGEQVIITGKGQPYLQLISHRKQTLRQPGRFKGQIKIAEDFDDTAINFSDGRLEPRK